MSSRISQNSSTEQTPDLSDSIDDSSGSCWQKFKSKLTSFGRKVEDWTYSKLPPTAAKCVLILIKHLPIAVAMLLLPSSIVLGLFAIGVVVRIICPDVFTFNPTLKGVFATAARTMGVYSAIMGIYNAFAISFSSTPYLNFISMGIYLGITGATFFAADQWTDADKSNAAAQKTPAAKSTTPVPAAAPAEASIPPSKAKTPAAQPLKPPTPSARVNQFVATNDPAKQASLKARPPTPSGKNQFVPFDEEPPVQPQPAQSLPPPIPPKPTVRPGTPNQKPGTLNALQGSNPPAGKSSALKLKVPGPTPGGSRSGTPLVLDPDPADIEQPGAEGATKKPASNKSSRAPTPKRREPDAQTEDRSAPTAQALIAASVPEPAKPKHKSKRSKVRKTATPDITPKPNGPSSLPPILAEPGSPPEPKSPPTLDGTPPKGHKPVVKGTSLAGRFKKPGPSSSLTTPIQPAGAITTLPPKHPARPRAGSVALPSSEEIPSSPESGENSGDASGE